MVLVDGRTRMNGQPVMGYQPQTGLDPHDETEQPVWQWTKAYHPRQELVLVVLRPKQRMYIFQVQLDVRRMQ